MPNTTGYLNIEPNKLRGMLGDLLLQNLLLLQELEHTRLMILETEEKLKQLTQTQSQDTDNGN